MVGGIQTKKLIKYVYPNLILIKIHKNIIQNKNKNKQTTVDQSAVKK